MSSDSGASDCGISGSGTSGSSTSNSATSDSGTHNSSASEFAEEYYDDPFRVLIREGYLNRNQIIARPNDFPADEQNVSINNATYEVIFAAQDVLAVCELYANKYVSLFYCC